MRSSTLYSGCWNHIRCFHRIAYWFCLTLAWLHCEISPTAFVLLIISIPERFLCSFATWPICSSSLVVRAEAAETRVKRGILLPGWSRWFRVGWGFWVLFSLYSDEKRTLSGVSVSASWIQILFTSFWGTLQHGPLFGATFGQFGVYLCVGTSLFDAQTYLMKRHFIITL